jgi:hypothetical protein
LNIIKNFFIMMVFHFIKEINSYLMFYFSPIKEIKYPLKKVAMLQNY